MCSRFDDPTQYDDPETIQTAVEAAKARPRCHAVIGHAPTPYGEMALRCNQVVGVVTWLDSAGLTHAACPIHVKAWRQLWPVVP